MTTTTELDAIFPLHFCGGRCPGALEAHHQLDCTSPLVSNAAQAGHLFGSLLGGTYKPAHRLQMIARAQRHASELAEALVEEARAEGMSWADIGEQLGVSKQAATQKYGKKS